MAFSIAETDPSLQLAIGTLWKGKDYILVAEGVLNIETLLAKCIIPPRIQVQLAHFQMSRGVKGLLGTLR